MTTPAFLTSDQVAERLALSGGGKAFLRQRQRLETETLFPPPMPTQRKPLRWKAAEVDAWINRQGIATQPDAPTPPPIPFRRSPLEQLARTA